MDNCVQLRCRSPFHYKFMFVDTQEHVSKRLLADSCVHASRVRELAKQGSPFRLIMCNIRRKDLDEFGQMLEKLKNNILLLGYRDYDEMCETLRKLADEAG